MDKRKVALGALCVLVFLVAAGYLAYYITSLKNNTAIYNDLQSSVVESTLAPTQSPEETATPTEESVAIPPVVIPIDFDALHEINEDAYAWIEIPDTEVSYPILRHATDDAYYLNYTIEHAYGLPGSIYTENADALDFSDFNTVIYGHNMANDTMFGSLNNYRDQSYFQENNIIYIYTETEIRAYQIFAAIVYDDRYIPYQYDDADPDDCQAFLDSIYNNRNLNDIIDDSVTVTTDSKLVTLSTCIGNMPNNRYLVVAVYVGE